MFIPRMNVSDHKKHSVMKRFFIVCFLAPFTFIVNAQVLIQSFETLPLVERSLLSFKEDVPEIQLPRYDETLQEYQQSNT